MNVASETSIISLHHRNTIVYLGYLSVCIVDSTVCEIEGCETELESKVCLIRHLDFHTYHLWLQIEVNKLWLQSPHSMLVAGAGVHENPLVPNYRPAKHRIRDRCECTRAYAQTLLNICSYAGELMLAKLYKVKILAFLERQT